MLDKRFEHLLAVGVQGGAYLAGRVRLTARVLMFTSGADDNMVNDYSYSDSSPYPQGYQPVASDKPVLIYGASLGAAPVVGRNFIFSPGVAFLRTNVGDYGSLLALSLPFEWVTDTGARFGFEVDIGRAFGGTLLTRCNLPAAGCNPGDERTVDRPAGPGFYAAFESGWGFNHPAPKPAE